MDDAEIAKQLIKPSGDRGKEVGGMMNLSNRSLYDLALSLIDLKDSDRLLEIGFGNGEFIPEFFKKNEKITVCGVDYSDVMCAEAIARNKRLIDQKRLFIQCLDAAVLPFNDGYFDRALTVNTIYFWPDPARQLAEIARTMKIGGQLVIGFRPASVMKNTRYVSAGFTLYEAGQVSSLAEQSGFRVRRTERREIVRKMLDGTDGRSVDICLVTEKVG